MRAITKGVILAGALIVFAVVALKGAAILIPTGTWVPQTNLSSARANASAALLQDGRVLITGGDSGSGPVATADFFAADGTISAAPPMVNARSKHVAVTLLDGRVLVAGGITGGGSCTSTAEVYDPATNSWTSIGTGMTEARSSASAALLADGRVVIAGGQNGSSISSTIEIFDPVAGSFSFVGTMSSPRTQDAMAVLQDGRVIITGGSNGTSPVASTDIFDPVAGTIGAGPNLAVARFGHSATTLLDGQVVVIGGNNGNADPAQMDLASAELFDPPAGTFTTLAANMATPREGHLAILLPNNNNVLIVGGMSGGAAIAAAELFMPQESSQGAWTYGFGSTDSMSTARSNATGSANQVNAPTSVMQRNGVVMVAGGNDASGNALTSTEAYGYATIQTDQGDYPPGTTVTITGSGWKPGETVNLELVESPLIDTHGPFSAVADANGNIQNASFVPNLEDIGVRFYLTAVGQTSRYQALTTFTDNKNVTVAFASTGSGTVVSTPAGMACTDTGGTASGTCVVSVGNTAQVTLTATSTSPSTIGAWTVPVSYTINSGCTSGSTTCTFTLDNSSQTVTLAFNPGAASQYVVKSSNNSPTAGAPVTITAQLADSGGNPVPTSGEIVTWSKTGSGGSFGSPTSTTNASGVATVTFTTAATVTTYTVTATDNTLPTNLTGTSGNIATVAGTASQLLFQQQPTNTVAGVAITPAITVNEEDANGNVLTGDSSTSITIAILNNPGGGTLSGTTSQKVSNGIATFNDLSINNADTGYTLQAKHGTLTAATSSPFNITAATVATTLTLNSVSPNSVPFGSTGPVTFSGTLTRNDTSAGVVGATVNFSVDGGAAIPATTGAGGVATVTTYNPSALSVGPHNVAASFTAATISGTSYLGSSSGTLPLTVSQKTVTANVTASNKTYDRTSAATITSCTLNGVLTGDVGNVGCSALGPNTFSDANVGNAKTVTATGIALSGAAAGNYTLNGVTTATTTANITTAALTATLTAANKTYDSTTTEPDASMSCSVATVFTGDTVTCAATSGNFNSSQVATATQVTATVTISGTSAGNYTLGLAGTSTNSTSAMATAQITTAALTATLTAANKTYDGTATEPNANLSCSVATVFTGDTVNCAASSGTFNSSQVATATQVTATVTISGASAGNYTLGTAGTSTNSTSAMATAQITTAALTATLTAANKTYDGTATEPNANLSCSVATVFTGDTVNCAASSGTFNTSQVATATQVTATVTIGGASAGNYTLGLAGTSLNSTSAIAAAHINPAPTSTSMNSSANPSTDGQSVTFTATVMNTAGAGVSTATPTGSVQFVIDGSNFGSPVPVAGSGATATAASLSTTTLTVGPHSVVATYTNSDGNFVGSMSSTFTQQVNYGFLGLQSPYMPPPTTFNVKRTMPLKWQYTNSGGAVVNSASANPVVMIQGPYACGTANSAGDITVSDAGASGYQYDSTTNTWQFNWQVKGNAPGCYDIFIKSQQSGQTNGAFPINVVNQ